MRVLAFPWHVGHWGWFWGIFNRSGSWRLSTRCTFTRIARSGIKTQAVGAIARFAAGFVHNVAAGLCFPSGAALCCNAAQKKQRQEQLEVEGGKKIKDGNDTRRVGDMGDLYSVHEAIHDDFYVIKAGFHRRCPY